MYFLYEIIIYFILNILLMIKWLLIDTWLFILIN